MIVSINQPAYLPWLGYFDRIDASDVHVILDHVQFEKNSFVNRNKIRSPNETSWLTIPIKTSGQFGDLAINNLSSSSRRWSKVHPKSLQAAYGRCPAFNEFWDDLRKFYSDKFGENGDDSFLPFVNLLNSYFLKRLRIQDKSIVFSSSMELQSSKSQLVLDICQNLGATTYISGPMGRDYLDLEAFSEVGIEVVFHDYKPVEYQQAWPGFFNNLAVVDPLLTHGGEATRSIMLAGRKINNYDGEKRG